jgi:hypothetical protein
LILWTGLQRRWPRAQLTTVVARMADEVRCRCDCLDAMPCLLRPRCHAMPAAAAVAGSCTWLPIVEGNRPLTRIAM